MALGNPLAPERISAQPVGYGNPLSRRVWPGAAGPRLTWNMRAATSAVSNLVPGDYVVGDVSGGSWSQGVSPTNGLLVGFQRKPDSTANTLTITTTSGKIFGPGCSSAGVSSYPLQANGEHIVLSGDGTNLWVVDGSPPVARGIAGISGANLGNYTTVGDLAGTLQMKGNISGTAGNAYWTVGWEGLYQVNINITWNTNGGNNSGYWQLGVIQNSGYLDTNQNVGLFSPEAFPSMTVARQIVCSIGDTVGVWWFGSGMSAALGVNGGTIEIARISD